jgi:hypothetical protein
MHIVLVWLHVRIAANACKQRTCTVPQHAFDLCLTEGASMTSICHSGHEHDLMLCCIGFAKDQRKLEEIIGELEKQGVKP